MDRFLLFTLPDVYILKDVLNYIYQLPTQLRLLDYSGLPALLGRLKLLNRYI